MNWTYLIFPAAVGVAYLAAVACVSLVAEALCRKGPPSGAADAEEAPPARQA